MIVSLKFYFNGPILNQLIVLTFKDLIVHFMKVAVVLGTSRPSTHQVELFSMIRTSVQINRQYLLL